MLATHGQAGATHQEEHAHRTTRALNLSAKIA
jgi:hypothetical protein